MTSDISLTGEFSSRADLADFGATLDTVLLDQWDDEIGEEPAGDDRSVIVNIEISVSEAENLSE